MLCTDEPIVALVRELYEKAYIPIVLTLFGIVIVVNLFPEKAEFPMLCTDEPIVALVN